MRRILSGRRPSPSDPRVWTMACALLALLLGCGGSEPETAATSSAASSDEAGLDLDLDEYSETDAAEEGPDASGNHRPVIKSVTLSPEAPVPGSPVRVRVEAGDRDGDPIKLFYEWTIDGEPTGNGMSKLPLHDAVKDSVVEVTVVASDGKRSSKPAVASAVLANQAPRIAQLGIRPGLEITAGEEIVIEPKIEDADGDEFDVTYQWEVNGILEPESSATFSTSELQVGDEIRVEVSVEDFGDLGEPFASPAIRVVNRPPRVTSKPSGAGGSDGFDYQLQAEDPDEGDSLVFTLEEGPAGMEIDAVTGALTWKPQADQAGEHSVKISVDDQKGGRIAHDFNVSYEGVAAPVAEVAP